MRVVLCGFIHLLKRLKFCSPPQACVDSVAKRSRFHYWVTTDCNPWMPPPDPFNSGHMACVGKYKGLYKNHKWNGYKWPTACKMGIQKVWTVSNVQCFAMKKNTQSMSTRPIVTLDIVLDDGWTTIIRWSCPWQSDASGRTTRTSQVGRSSRCSLGCGVTLVFLWNATWEKHPEKGEKRMLQLATSNWNNPHVWPEKSGKTGPQDAIAAKNIAKSTWTTDDVTWDKTSWITIQLNPLLFQPENTTVRVPKKHPKPYLWASGRSNDIDIAASTRKTALDQVEQHHSSETVVQKDVDIYEWPMESSWHHLWSPSSCIL